MNRAIRFLLLAAGGMLGSPFWSQAAGPGDAKPAATSPFDVVAPLPATNHPRAALTDGLDPAIELSRHVYLGWLPIFRQTVATPAPTVGDSSATSEAAPPLGGEPEPSAPLAPLDPPAKPPL
ncbi:MAG TPA: hypothetical protein VFE24_18390 [Pirellulales bacterium]|jgi:hypothetical protein|nr:hypothetical protein [Pirellulales bacterium]